MRLSAACASIVIVILLVAGVANARPGGGGGGARGGRPSMGRVGGGAARPSMPASRPQMAAPRPQMPMARPSMPYRAAQHAEHAASRGSGRWRHGRHGTAPGAKLPAAERGIAATAKSLPPLAAECNRPAAACSASAQYRVTTRARARSAHRVRHPPLAWQGVPAEPVSLGRALGSARRGLRRLRCPVVLASAPGQAQLAGQAADSQQSRHRCQVRSAGLVVVDRARARCQARLATVLEPPRQSRRFRVRTSPARAAGWPAVTGPDGLASAT